MDMVDDSPSQESEGRLFSLESYFTAEPVIVEDEQVKMTISTGSSGKPSDT